MIDFYVMDGKKLIDFKPKHINYARAFHRRCEKINPQSNMTMRKMKETYPDEFIKSLFLLIKLKSTTGFDVLQNAEPEFIIDEFRVIGAIDDMIGLLTPREFMNMFPIEKSFDGEKYQCKDYFYTMDYVKKFGIDKVIGDKAAEFLMEYQNFDVERYMVYWMVVVNRMSIVRDGKDILLDFMEELGVEPHMMHQEGKYMIDNETGEKFKIKRPMPKIKKLFSIM